MRDVERRGGSVVVSYAADGEHFENVATLDKDRFGAESLERPALVRVDGGWRLYVCCATPGSKHWWIDAIDASAPAALAEAEARTVFPGDERTGVKDPVVRRDGREWRAWVCCHPLDEPGEEDRMTTALATSDDGLDWRWEGTVLGPRPGAWDARGARVTAVLPDGTTVLRRPGHEGGELPRAHGHRRPGQAGGRRPLPRRARPAGRRLAALLRGAAARRQPRAAHGANVNGGWVGVGAERPCGHECRLKHRMGGRGDIRRVAAARSQFLPSRR